MRLLLADPPAPAGFDLGSSLTEADLAALYAVPATTRTWLRANFASSVDGAVTGGDGRSGSVNSEADHVVFDLVRALSDVVVVGAGTVRGEGYGPLSAPEHLAHVRADAGIAPVLPLVVVTNHAEVPERLRGAAPGRVLLATHAGAEALDSARSLLGEDNVLVCGRSHVDPESLLTQLGQRGWSRVLTEGGPHLLSTFVGAGVIDELCLSITPVVVGGDGPRMTQGLSLSAGFAPRMLVEEDGTVMGRWLRHA